MGPRVPRAGFQHYLNYSIAGLPKAEQFTSLNLTFLVSRTVILIITNEREAREMIDMKVPGTLQAFSTMPSYVMKKGNDWSRQQIPHEYPQCGEILNTIANETDRGSAPTEPLSIEKVRKKRV